MAIASDAAQRIKTALTENFSLKLLSFVFALALYSLSHGSQDAQRSVPVSLLVLLPPQSANRVLVSPLPPTVRVTLRGPRAILDEMRPEDIGNLQVDVRSGVDRRIALEPHMVKVPAGLRIEQIDPPFIDLTWEDQITRELDVQVGMVGKPAPGFVVHGAVVPEPAVVQARGPKSEVEVLQHVRADSLDVTGLTEGRHVRTLGLDRPRGRVTLDVSSVQVTVNVGREVAERVFDRVPVGVVGQAHGRAQPADVDVRLVCPPEIVRAIRRDQIVARAEVGSGAPSGSVAVPVHVNIDKCEAQVTPGTVIVRW